MPKVIITGSGSTRRMSRSYSAADPADQEALLTAMKAWCDAGDPFLAKLDRIEAHCRAELGRAGIAYDPSAMLIGPRRGDEDTRVGYAIRTSNLLRLLRRFLKPEDADAKLAATFAFDLGALLAEASMKPIADAAYKSAVGRAKATRAPAEHRRGRNTEIAQAYERAVAQGVPRKRLVAMLAKQFELSERRLRQIIPPARRK